MTRLLPLNGPRLLKMISTCRRCAQLARVAKKAEHRAFWWNATAKAEPVLQKVEEHDVVIVGGGIAGLALAASLCKCSARCIAMIDAIA